MCACCTSRSADTDSDEGPNHSKHSTAAAACCTARIRRSHPTNSTPKPGFFSSLFGVSKKSQAKKNGLGSVDAAGSNGETVALLPALASAVASGSGAPGPLRPSPMKHDEAESVAAVRRHTSMLGGEQGILLYSISDLPGGQRIQAHSAGASSDRCVQQAQHIPPNTIEGVPIETDCFTGKVIVMYRKPAHSCSKSPYDPYFKGRKRNWEIRVQGRFKRVPEGDMYIGIVARDFNYNQRVAAHSRFIQKSGMALVNSYDLYFAWGDRCEEALRPNAELSHLVTGINGWDQVIVTPTGQSPPDLTCDLQALGDAYGKNYERAKLGIRLFGKEVEDTFRNMNLDDTYTLCFWGVSQVIDLLGWKMKLGMQVSMATFFEESPLHVAMYEIERSDDISEERHLESRKKYYLDFMFWSNAVCCPALPSRYIFCDAPKAVTNDSSEPISPPPAILLPESATLHGGGRRGVSPTSSNGSNNSGQNSARSSSLLALWSQRLRWIPQSACSLPSTHHRKNGRA